MYLHLAYSADAFARLIKFRITQAFLPITSPISYPLGSQSWLDGLIVHDVKLEKVIEAPAVLNEWSATGALEAIKAGYSYDSVAIAMDISMTIFYAKVEDVANAGTNDPVTGSIPIPIGAFRVFLRCSIDANGIPQVQMQPDQARLGASNFPQPVKDLIAAGVTQNFPFDVATILSGVIPERIRRVRNCGLTLDGNDNPIFRFDFPSLAEGSVVTRQQDWQNFSHNPIPARLGGSDWCVDIEGAVMAAQAAMSTNPNIDDQHPVYFDPGIDWGFENGRPPRFVIKKRGRVQNACAGNDVRFDAYVYADVTVIPNTNTIRGVISFDLDKNDWDVAKCFGLLVVNPLFLVITAFDQGVPLPLNFVLALPIRPLALGAAVALLIAGTDQTIAEDFMKKQLAQQPNITSLPNDQYAWDQTLNFNSPLVQNWPMLTDAVGEEGRLVLRGELRVPPPILPKLKAKDLEGFSQWHLVDRCEPGRGQEVTASLQLFLEAGYRQDLSIKSPLIRLRYATPYFQIVNDLLGIYSYAGSDYRQVSISFIPGKMEAILKGTTLERSEFQSFKQNPYPLRIRLFTNGGVREYAFASPGVYTDYQETVAQAAERINNCKRMMHESWFSFRWLVDPPPDGKIGQRWEVHLRGLEHGRNLKVWSESGELLSKYTANQHGRIDVSLLLPPNVFTPILVMGLDDSSFVPANEIRERRNLAALQQNASFDINVRQTPFFPLEEFVFEEPVTAVSVRHLPGIMQVRGITSSGSDVRHCFTNMYPLLLRLQDDLQGEVLINFHEHEKGRNENNAYSIEIGENLFLQLSQDRHLLMLYHAGIPRVSSGTRWEEHGMVAL